jgi:hypothetical protein
MAAPLVATPSTRALDDLAPQHCAVCARARVRFCLNSSCSGLSHDTTDSLPHTGTCPVCGKLSDSSCLLPVQEEFAQKCMTACVSAQDGGTAVGPHDGRGRGGGVRGAELDEYDGLARLSAAVPTARVAGARDGILFSYRVTATNAKSRSVVRRLRTTANDVVTKRRSEMVTSVTFLVPFAAAQLHDIRSDAARVPKHGLAQNLSYLQANASALGEAARELSTRACLSQPSTAWTTSCAAQQPPTCTYIRATVGSQLL